MPLAIRPWPDTKQFDRGCGSTAPRATTRRVRVSQQDTDTELNTNLGAERNMADRALKKRPVVDARLWGRGRIRRRERPVNGVTRREECRDLHEWWRGVRGNEDARREASIIECGRHGGEGGENTERRGEGSARLAARQRRKRWGDRRGGGDPVGLVGCDSAAEISLDSATATLCV